MRNSDIKSNQTNIIVEKLLSNGFARQVWLTDPHSSFPKTLSEEDSKCGIINKRS